MKSILVVLFSLVCLTTCVSAQAQKEVPQKIISYARPTPSFATHMIPVQGKSLFWGTITPKPKSTPLGFHLYALYASELRQFTNPKCHLTLDVFTLQPKIQLINRVSFIYKAAFAPNTFGMSFSWIDLKAQTIPLIVVKSFSKSEYGSLGIEHFVAFAKGWKSAASVNNLVFGGWHASDTLGAENRLISGPNNFLKIQAAMFPAISELTPEQATRDYTFTLQWNQASREFVPHSASATTLERYFSSYQ